MSNPVTPIAEAISKVADALTKWWDKTPVRRSRQALNSARIAMNRAEKLYPDLVEDKQYKKYRNHYDKMIAIN